MLNFTDWLSSYNGPRVLIAQLQVLSGGSLVTRYVSTHTVTVDSVEYLPFIKGTLQINTAINLEFGASMSVGGLDLINSDKYIDSWLNDNWVNKSCKVYVGPLPGSYTNQSLSNDYELVLDGVTEDIDSKSLNVLSLKLRDKLEKVNYPVTEAILGNYFHGSILADDSATYNNPAKTSIKPLVFGEVHNITPLSTDPTQLEYMVSDGPVERIIEVLDNGVPVVFRTVKTVAEVGDIPPGSFRLNSSPVGTVTASVQGVAKTINISGNTYVDSYTNTASNIIATILKLYGKQLQYSELDSTSFSSLGSAPVGVYLKDRTNAFVVCGEVAKSINCALVVSPKGVVKLVEVKLPTAASISINDTNTVLNTMKLNSKTDVDAGVRLGYARNYTVMSGIVTGIPEEHKQLLSTEYMEIVVKDTTAATDYNITVEPDLEATYLITSADATSKANDRLALRNKPRKVLAIQGVLELMQLEAGTPVVVDINRFGISTGSLGLVLSTRPDWVTGKIDLEILV